MTGATLTRFFGFHVALLPGLTLLLLLTHLALVQYFGMSVPPAVEARWKAVPSEAREIKFFPNFFLRELMAWYIALGVLWRVGGHSSLGTGNKGRSVCSRAGWHPAGMVFHVHVPDVKKIPAKLWFVDGDVLGILMFGVAGILWLLLPFFDQPGGRRGRRSVPPAGICALSYIIAMTIYGYMAK